MHQDPIVFSTFVVFTGAALLAAIALFARQSMLVSYIVLGIVAGPSVSGLIQNRETIAGIGHVGIIFLLYLLGLNLHPQKLIKLLREALLVTVLSSASFALLGGAVAYLWGFEPLDAALVGAACMFSSTIIGLKLLPTTALHHRHVGEVIISVLLLQDLIAIFLLLVLDGAGADRGMQASAPWWEVARLAGALALLGAGAYAGQRFLLLPLLRRFDTIQEFVFLTAIGWCLGIAELAHVLQLSYEIGAFIAGIALAASAISTFIAESLKPLRDFFLIMFFFSLGAGFPLAVVPQVIVPALLIAMLMLLVKPFVFERLLRFENETANLSREIGFRLGQCSEFALLIAVLAVETGLMSQTASNLIQTATLLSFVGSSYIIVMWYPTPMALSASLRRD